MKRPSPISGKPGLLLVTSLALLLTGCATSGSPVAVAPVLPDVPVPLATECGDPGVGEVADVAGAVREIGNQRLYAACSKRKHRDIKTFYRGVQTRFSK